MNYIFQFARNLEELLNELKREEEEEFNTIDIDYVDESTLIEISDEKIKNPSNLPLPDESEIGWMYE